MDEQTISKKYKKQKLDEHILQRPDTYIGSIEPTEEKQWAYNDGAMTLQNVTFIPGMMKLFDEITLNAWDQYIRTRLEKKHSVNAIDFEVDQETGKITISNNGQGIDIAIHPEHNVYTVELIFGQLLTSTNYNDDEERVTGGKNGYGGKLANIFSTSFNIETVDVKTKQYYSQSFSDHMKQVDKPVIKENYSGSPFTKISFIPDFARFGISQNGWSDDMMKVFERRAHEIAACCVGASPLFVKFNGKLIHYNNFKKFISLHVEDSAPDKMVTETIGQRWEIGATLSDGFQQISFVNGIRTLKGGKHVDHVVNIICKRIVESIKKKNKALAKEQIKPSYIKENLFVFIKGLVVNPSFDSQTKENLITPPSKFGSTIDISDKFIDGLMKLGLSERVIDTYKFKETKLLKKNDGKKSSRVFVEKLDDANCAGGPKAQMCTLYVTEGDSAKSMAISGLAVIGRDYNGVWPVQGKLINVYKKDTAAGLKQVLNNKELVSLQKIIGLELDKHYEDTSSLRYGKIKIMADQDYDGFHICGLFMNLFHVLWPSLFSIDGFITSMSTPIVKVNRKSEQLAFYSIKDYEDWKANIPHNENWNIKYYKGLGTSTAAEAREYFKENRETRYLYTEDSPTSLSLAFHPKKTAERKDWLRQYDANQHLDESLQDVSFDDFIHKKLIQFSNSDNNRSLPSLVDGLKPSQRKVLYACFKRNLKKEIKVAQLSGYVAEHSGYHHGEASLHSTIINMAQDYVGSNNINLLLPIGQFGTRLNGGSDSASPRYISTKLNSLSFKLFPPEDQPLLNYLDDDGFSIEPSYYVPIIPTVLCNGFIGVGTGFSTGCPAYNPNDLADWIMNKMNKIESKALIPYYNGFKGRVRLNEEATSAEFYGDFRITDYQTIVISELPIGEWTEKYKAMLEDWISNNDANKRTKSDAKKTEYWWLKDYRTQCTESCVHFELTIDSATLREWHRDIKKNKDVFPTIVHQKLKLGSKMPLTNIHLFDANGKITKYKTPEQICEEHFGVRLDFYTKRKEYLLAQIAKEILVLKQKVRFIRENIDDTISIRTMTREQLVQCLKDRKYEPSASGDYQYLIGMPMYSLTADKVAELENELAQRVQARTELENTTTEQMWTRELLEFKEVYQKFVV